MHVSFFIQLQDTPSLELARQLLTRNDYDIRFDLGFGKMADSFTKFDVDQLVSGVCSHLIIYKQKAELDQIVQGLQSLDVHKLIRGNTAIANFLFSFTTKVKLEATTLRKLFKTSSLSPQGSNQRTREEELMYYWYELLVDVENDEVSVGKCFNIWLYNCYFGDLIIRRKWFQLCSYPSNNPNICHRV